MMASKSTPGLLKAIGDFNAEHGSDKEHESTTAMLSRVAGSLGPKKSDDSPGSREARAAGERSMGSEEGRDDSGGNRESNKPGSVDFPDPVADQHEGSPGQMTGTEPVPSAGNIRSTLSAGAMPSGALADIRRMAAVKGLESGRSSEGNKDSNPAQPFPPDSGKTGDVSAPAKDIPDRNTGPGFEGGPPRGGQDNLSGDGWSKAREKARKMVPAR
jgi:hypothetical protein